MFLNNTGEMLRINNFSSGKGLHEAAKFIHYCYNGGTPPYGKGDTYHLNPCH